MILSKALTEQGFEVSQAADGRAGLEQMERDGGSFQLVMVDWNMPELSGLEFVQAVRAQPRFGSVRLLMVTTETEIEQMVRALEAGADEYLMKPFAPESVKDKLRLLGMAE
jgi:two-component system chemotaxis response regulator CheY